MHCLPSPVKLHDAQHPSQLMQPAALNTLLPSPPAVVCNANGSITVASGGRRLCGSGCVINIANSGTTSRFLLAALALSPPTGGAADDALLAAALAARANGSAPGNALRPTGFSSTTSYCLKQQEYETDFATFVMSCPNGQLISAIGTAVYGTFSGGCTSAGPPPPPACHGRLPGGHRRGCPLHQPQLLQSIKRSETSLMEVA
jgi:hypothetical protein